MGITRRAARLCFATLLVGAGAAAVAAKPSGTAPAPMVEVVPGDPRLDLGWALTQSGMSDEDARRVSVLLVDQVDPGGEFETLTPLWSAELWWRDLEPEDDFGAPIRMTRTTLAFVTGTSLERVAASSKAVCPIGSQTFFPMRVASTRLAPIPQGTTVLVRLRGVWLCGVGTGANAKDLQPLGPEAVQGRAGVLCEPVDLDPESGLEVPSHWASRS